MKDSYTRLHYILTSNDDFEPWLETLLDFLGATIYKIVTPESGYILLKEDFSELDEDTVEFLSILETDFSNDFRLVMGIKGSKYDQLEHDFILKHPPKALFTKLSQLYIETTLPTQGIDTSLFEPLITYLQEQKETHSIIQTLWKTSINISQSASVNYLHRNTLLYRIQQFYDYTHFDLKDPYDLLICYLISLKEDEDENNPNPR